MRSIICHFFGLNPDDDEQSSDMLIIDIRPKKAYKTAHIKESINIPLEQKNSLPCMVI